VGTRASSQDAGVFLECLRHRIGGGSSGRRLSHRRHLVALGLLHQPTLRPLGHARHRRGSSRRGSGAPARPLRLPPHRRVDYAATAVFAAAISALLIGLVEAGQEASWTGGSVLGLLALAAALLVVFIRIERMAPDPMLPLTLFSIPMVRAAAVTGFLSGTAMFGAIAYVPLFLQAVTGSSAMQARVLLMPFVIGWVACSILGARLVLRVSYRSVVLAGMAALTGA